MPVRGRGAFPTPAPVYRDEGDGSGGLQRNAGPVIAEYRALKKLQRSDEALQILRRIGAIVRPIMLKHGWRLPLLVEMYPKNDNLLGLNVNRGQKIALRLRRPHNDADFIDEQSLTETMLHELTHNIRGPHDEVFYKHLELLTQEWYDLRQNACLPGQGFWTSGQTLGSSNGKGALTQADAKARAVEMARKRERANARAGAHQLGGPSSAEQLLTPRELAAVAAERRKVIAAGCPSGDVDRNCDAAHEQEEQEQRQGTQIMVIEIDSDSEEEDDFEIIEDSRQQPASAQPAARSATLVDSDEDGDDVVVVDVRRANAAPSARLIDDNAPAGPRKWTCQACTLANAHDALLCAACDIVRPGVANWTCRECQHRMLGAFADFWCCSSCGTVKIA